MQNKKNMGVGSIILQAIIESAKQVGYDQIELEVVEENERAHQLYKK